ncbi:hypothetical protein Y032_0308g2047 [Ancylostoma ceylanicum]|uniref:Uncharacterized protein n=1 Tax=Ancylostoma ceylanicum TaxID=53326 RepID=A0A016S2J9_9BILA|nr:hypothetical protein Y032_0308g2047 [Ancylostoma ceylanicum]
MAVETGRVSNSTVFLTQTREARFEFWFLQTIKGSVTSHITHIRKFDGRLCCPTPGFLGTVNSKAETKSCE